MEEKRFSIFFLKTQIFLSQELIKLSDSHEYYFLFFLLSHLLLTIKQFKINTPKILIDTTDKRFNEKKKKVNSTTWVILSCNHSVITNLQSAGLSYYLQTQVRQEINKPLMRSFTFPFFI